MTAREAAIQDALQAAYDLIMLLAFAKPDAEVGVPQTFAVLGQLRAALHAVTAPEDGGLDAAWAEAKAALPEGWAGPILSPLIDGWWEAAAKAPTGETGESWDIERLDVVASASSEAAALRALAARLRADALEAGS